MEIKNNVLISISGADIINGTLELPNGIKELSNAVFENNKDITKIALPSSLEKIGAKAFCGCRNLSEINLSDSILEIGDSAFEKCFDLSKITLPKNLRTINNNLFANCKKLNTIELPTTLGKIGDNAFCDCINLEEFNIPQSVSELGKNIFMNCKQLREVFITGNIKEIRENVFNNCISLISINLSENIEYIGSKAFCNCELLNNIVIPKNVHKIGSYAFSNCINLEHVMIQSLLEELKNGTFENCRSLKEIELPNSLKKIGIGVFKNCKRLTKIDMPNNLKSINMNAFWGCENLKKIEFNLKLEEIGDYAFGDTKIEEIELPKSLEKFGINPFHLCTNLKKIQIYKLLNDDICDETNIKLREIVIDNKKVDFLKPIKKIIRFKQIAIIKYNDESFQIIDKQCKYYDQNYFESTFPQHKAIISRLMYDNNIFNIYYWESILEEQLSKINPVGIIALPPNINTIKAFNYKNDYYNVIIKKYDIDNIDDEVSIIKFITIFGGLCKKNNLIIDKIITDIGINNVFKQFRNVYVKEFNQDFIDLYIKLMQNYSVNEINNIMPFTYNNIQKVINSQDNITIDLIETLQLQNISECKTYNIKQYKINNKITKYDWLDIPNPINLLWGLILASVSGRDLVSATLDRTVRSYLIKDDQGMIVASCRAYYSEEEKYLLFNSIILSQSFVTIGYDAEKVKNLLIDYVLASIEDTLNFLNEENTIVTKVHVGISGNSIREQLANRGTKVIEQNI